MKLLIILNKILKIFLYCFFMYNPNIAQGSSIKELQNNNIDSDFLTDDTITEKKGHKFKISKIRENNELVQQDGGASTPSSKPSLVNNIPDIYIDSIILFIVYVILSQNIVKQFLTKYLYDVTSNNIISTIIQGIILVICYMVIKKVIYQIYK